MRRETFVDTRQDSATTLAVAIDRYIAEYDNPDSTRVSRCKRLSQHLGDFSLSNLSSKQLAEYRKKRLKLAAPMTVIHELNQLHRILVIATTEWGITRPDELKCLLAQQAKVPKGSDDVQRVKCWCRQSTRYSMEEHREAAYS